jgi:hypothetical protein
MFLGPNIPKRGKIYLRTTNYTKHPYTIPSGNKVCQITVKCTNIFHSKALQNIPKLGYFVL